MATRRAITMATRRPRRRPNREGMAKCRPARAPSTGCSPPVSGSSTDPVWAKRYLKAMRLLAERGLNARAGGMVQRARRMTSELGMPPPDVLVQAEASLT